MVSLQPQQSQLRDAAGRAQPVRTSRVRLAGCMGNATKASAEGLDAHETFVAPAVLEATRVVCLAPPRQAPLVTDLAIALNGQVRVRVRVWDEVRVMAGVRVERDEGVVLP